MNIRPSRARAFIRELQNFYHHHPKSKKRKSSEGKNSGSIQPYGRYGNAGKTSKTISAIAILWPVRGHFREEGCYGGGRCFHFPCSCANHPVDWDQDLLRENPSTDVFYSLILITKITISLPFILCTFPVEKQKANQNTDIDAKIGAIRGSAAWCVNLSPVFQHVACLSLIGWNETNNIWNCVSVAQGSFCIAHNQLDHIAPYFQNMILSKKDLERWKSGEIGTATCFKTAFHFGNVKAGKGLSSRTFWWGISVTRSGGFSYIRREKSSNRRAPHQHVLLD